MHTHEGSMVFVNKINIIGIIIRCSDCMRSDWNRTNRLIPREQTKIPID